MLSENIGFDMNEQAFEEYAGYNTFYHVMIDNEQITENEVSVQDNNTIIHNFKNALQATTFIELSKEKGIVCISNLRLSEPEIQVITKNNNNTKVIFRNSAGAYQIVKKQPRNLKFKTTNAIFGFYEWLNIVTKQIPANRIEEDIIHAFQTHLTNAEVDQLTGGARDYFLTLSTLFYAESSTAYDIKLAADISEFCQKIKKLSRKAFIIVDVQNDFCEGGSLEVPFSNTIFGPINQLRKKINFQMVVLTKDMHPQNHISFASVHNMNPYTTIDIDGLPQELWPDHCVRGTEGAELSNLLETNGNEFIVQKGTLPEEDAYSGFGKKEHPTNLLSLLKDHQIRQVIVVGLALDFCVGWTALDAQEAGFETYVVREATKAALSHMEQVMLGRLQKNGIKMLTKEETLKVFA